MIHPGVDARAWALPDAAGRAAAGALLSARSCRGSAPTSRSRSPPGVPELRLDLAGAPLPGDPPGFVAALRERAARPDLAGRVRFLGALDDPRTALADAHCLLHCADREPFGLALVEALAAGRPVVAPAAGGPLEIVTPACGRLYAPGRRGRGAAAVRAVLADAGAPAAARARAARFEPGCGASLRSGR